jgi:hypothetical protein
MIAPEGSTSAIMSAAVMWRTASASQRVVVARTIGAGSIAPLVSNSFTALIVSA